MRGVGQGVSPKRDKVHLIVCIKILPNLEKLISSEWNSFSPFFVTTEHRKTIKTINNPNAIKKDVYTT